MRIQKGIDNVINNPKMTYYEFASQRSPKVVIDGQSMNESDLTYGDNGWYYGN